MPIISKSNNESQGARGKNKSKIKYKEGPMARGTTTTLRVDNVLKLSTVFAFWV